MRRNRICGVVLTLEFALTLAHEAVASASDDALRQPGVSISCSGGVVADGYSRFSSSSATASFTCVVLSPPVPRKEWRLEDESIKWSVSPTPKRGSFTSPSLTCAILSLVHPYDFGVSYEVCVSVSWTLRDSKSAANETVTREARHVVDAVAYSFEMACSDGTASLSGDKLIDNHPAAVTVTARGCTRPDLLDLDISASPAEEGPLVNKAGTEMQFVKKGPLLFSTPKTFWYGKAKPDCCYTKRYPYAIHLLEASDGLVAIGKETVGWPNEHPEASVAIYPPENTAVRYASSDGRAFASVLFGRTVKKVSRVDPSMVTDQYQEETIREENFHVKQFLGEVPWSEGGEGNLYSLKKVADKVGRPYAGLGECVVWSGVGETDSAFRTRVEALITDELANEWEVSDTVFEGNRAFREVKAKAHAGYNAAWTYQCTYEANGYPAEDSVQHFSREDFE